MRTMTALFDNYAQAARAVRGIEAMGVPESDISLVVSTLEDQLVEAETDDDAAHGAERGVGIGAVVGGAGGLLAGLGALAIPGLGPVVAAGWLASAAIGVAAGAALGGATGGIIGTLTGTGVGESDAQVYAEGVRRGGSVVSVRVEDSKAESVARIFSASGEADIAERRRLYEEEGWSQAEARGRGEDPERERRLDETLPPPI
jgi:hypothetical protein